jgi:hypothetical protein
LVETRLKAKSIAGFPASPLITKERRGQRFLGRCGPRLDANYLNIK